MNLYRIDIMHTDNGRMIDIYYEAHSLDDAIGMTNQNYCAATGQHEKTQRVYQVWCLDKLPDGKFVQKPHINSYK